MSNPCLQACLEVRIPKDSVALVIGRGGANIREIQVTLKPIFFFFLSFLNHH